MTGILRSVARVSDVFGKRSSVIVASPALKSEIFVVPLINVMIGASSFTEIIERRSRPSIFSFSIVVAGSGFVSNGLTGIGIRSEFAVWVCKDFFAEINTA